MVLRILFKSNNNGVKTVLSLPLNKRPFPLHLAWFCCSPIQPEGSVAISYFLQYCTTHYHSIHCGPRQKWNSDDGIMADIDTICGHYHPPKRYFIITIEKEEDWMGVGAPLNAKCLVWSSRRLYLMKIIGWGDFEFAWASNSNNV